MDANSAVSIAGAQARGVTLATGEVLAVMQSLMSGAADSRARPPFGPLSAANIVIAADGSVASLACAVTPTVLEVAILVNELLPPGTPEVPGALRFAIGRAMHEVVAPPFDSLPEFSATLQRFETGDRAAVVRRLFARAAGTSAPKRVSRGFLLVPVAATLVAGLVLIGAGESMHRSTLVSRPATVATLPPTVPSPPPAFATARSPVGIPQPAVAGPQSAVTPQSTIVAPSPRRPVSGVRRETAASPASPARRTAKPQRTAKASASAVKSPPKKRTSRLWGALPRIRIKVEEL
jgi:hypothetical protein